MGRAHRGLFGCAPDSAYIESVLRDLSLWDRRDDIMMTLSGGMKRRVMIAKALAHEPRILFLDEPTAGVDVELRRDMWALVRRLRDNGVTIILTTHYIDEAEEMADRIGVINQGELIVVEEKAALMKQARQEAADAEPAGAAWPRFRPELERVEARAECRRPRTRVHVRRERRADRHPGAAAAAVEQLGIGFKDLNTRESSLEEIFVSLVSEREGFAAHERARLQPPRRLGDLPLRDGALPAHAAAERADAR